MPRAPCVYIMASDRNGTIYTGVTSNHSSASTNTARASGRVSRAAIGASCWLFYETRERMDEAIARKKQIKGGSRTKKMALIETMNPQWRDLYADLA